jgi:glycosyltransferase involved in cell wall biosynthesis
MVEVKGVNILLGAAAMILRKHSHLRILLVGDGPDLPKYRKRAAELGIEDAVTFTGLLENPTETGVFDASDIYCQPSLWQEASGFAVLEAMSFKLPVIASDTGGLAENIEHGQSGILVPVGSAQDMCAALDRLISNRVLRRDMGEAGYQLILKKHRIEDVARKYATLFIEG